MKAMQFGRKLIQCMFQGEEWPLIDGEAVELSLHVTRPEDDAGNILKGSEIDYPGYRRVTVPRTDDGWRRLDDHKLCNARDIAFPPVNRQKVGLRKYEWQFLLIRGATSGLPLRIAEFDKKTYAFDADNPLIIKAGNFFITEGAAGKANLKWRRALLDSEYLGLPFPLEKDEPFEIALYEDDPQDPAGNIVGRELDYPGYKRRAVERTDKEWSRHDNEAGNAHPIRFPGLYEETGKGRKWSVRWHAVMGKNSGFPVQVARLQDTLALSVGKRPVIDAGTLTRIEG